MSETLPRLTLDTILAADDLPTEEVPVPQWGGTVLIKAITKARQQHLRKLARLRHTHVDGRKAGEIDTDRLELLLVIESVVEPALTEAHIPALREKSSAALDLITRAVLRLNGMEEVSVAQAERSFPDES